MFVADGDSRRDTAVLLVGTADEFGINQRDIRAVSGGFVISDALAAILYPEIETEPSVSDHQPSGNRAAKNTVTEQE